MPIVMLRRADGGVSYASLAEGMDIEAWVAKWAQTASPSWLPLAGWAVIAAEDLPPRRWRSAWRHAGNAVTVPLEEARKLRKAELLREREARLTALRERLERAEDDNDGQEAARLRGRRKAMRNLEATLDARLGAIADLAALGAFVPEELQE